MMIKTLFDAVQAGDLALVKAQISKRPKLVNAKDLLGNSVVLTATYWGKREILAYLLRQKPRLSVFEAAAVGQLATVRAHVRRSAKQAFAYSHDGFTALHLAAFLRHKPVLDFLLKQGADVNAISRSPMRVQPLHSACAGNDLAICVALIRQGADVNARQQGGFTPLHAAAQHGNDALVSALLAAGADKSARTDTGKTAQDIAAETGHVELANRLTPQIGKFGRVILFVADLPKMRAFYEHVLGLTPTGAAEASWVSYDAGGMLISLHKQTAKKRSGGTAAQIVFRVADVEAGRALLVARGAPMQKTVDAGGFYFCDGSDPEGNYFQISSR